MITGTMEDLLGRIAYSVSTEGRGRPIAFLTGSGVSAGAIPMSREIVEIVRKALTKDDQRAFDEHLTSAADDADRYQQAFQWLGLRRDAGYRDRVIQLSTLRACDTSDIPETELLDHSGKLELDLDRWKLPKGQAALGRILTGMPQELRGPVLTTNFDPLTEIAVKKAGGNATYFVNADDTSFLANLRIQIEPFVLHLHGFWRNSSTLSTPEQLELGRPVLEASLGYLLERYTIVVVGYGGWTDVVTRIIQDLVSAQRVDALDILWAFYESESQLAPMIARFPVLASLIKAPGTVRFYTEIDANKFFPRLEHAIADSLIYPSTDRATIGRASLVGWTSVNSGFLNEYDHLATPAAAITFLDGRMPSWHDAVSKHVALREPAMELHRRIKHEISQGESSIDLVLGASGEGKSTIAMQFAALAARDPEFDAEVLYLSGDSFGSDTSIIGLPTDQNYLLVVDDAFRFAPRLQELAARMSATNRRRLHLVLVSRDTDWHNVGASHFGWNSHVKFRRHAIRGISRVDAASMVTTWERLGGDALGELGDLASSREREDALLASSQGMGLGPTDGTLLGALLSTRYGAGLREHIAQLMSRMRDRLIRGSASGDSLLDALVLTALPYAYGILDLEPEVLADALGLQRPNLIVDVLEPLGDEAAITYTSGRVVVRHEAIASSIIDICLEREYDLSRAARRLVAAAARRVERNGYVPRTGSIAYLAKPILDLPDLAVAAAAAAQSVAPSRLSYVTTLSTALRRNSDALAARKINESSLDLIDKAQNINQVRVFFTEWGVVEGNLGCWSRNAVLASLALQDSPNFGVVHRSSAGKSVSCLLLALSRLEEKQHDDRLVAGMAALSVLAREVDDKSARVWVREAERTIDRAGGSYPSLEDTGTLSNSIHQAVLVAKRRLDVPLPTSTPQLWSSYSKMISCIIGS